MLTLEVKSLSTSFHKYLDHMLVKFEQNRMVRLYKILSFFKKNAILENVSVTETTVWC